MYIYLSCNNKKTNFETLLYSSFVLKEKISYIKKKKKSKTKIQNQKKKKNQSLVLFFFENEIVKELERRKKKKNQFHLDLFHRNARK